MPRLMQRRSTSMPNRTGTSSPSTDAAPPAVQIPKTNVDPIWSLCPWPVVIETHGRVFEAPAVPAVNWLRHLMVDEGNVDIFGLAEELLPALSDFFYDNDLSLFDLRDTILDLIETVSARPWWVTIRLCFIARNNWHVLGPKLFIDGIDASTVSLAGWLDVLLYELMDSIEPEKATMFSMQLTATPESEVPEPTEDGELPESEEMPASAFLAMAD